MTDASGTSSILHVVASSHFGGAEQVAAQLVRRARARGETPRVFGLHGTEAEAGLVTSLGTPIEGPAARSPTRLLRADALRLATRVFFARMPGQLIHAHLPWPDRLGLALLARGTSPALITFQLLPSHPLGGLADIALGPLFSSRLTARISRRLAPLILVALTEVDRLRLLEEFPGARVEQVHNAPVEPQGPLPTRLPFGSGVRILSVGTLEARKGHDRVLRALASEQLRKIDFSLCVVGDGSDRLALETLARELEIAHKVTFMGRLPASRLYEQADLFISGSRAEGMPLVLLEAMAAGRAVAASPIASHREVLLGIAGALLDTDEQHWTAELQPLLTNPALRQRIAEEAKQRVELRFSAAAQDAAYQRLYTELTAV